MEDLIQGITPEIINKELILDGTGKNYRITKKRYFTNGQVIDEVITYKNPPSSDAWELIKHIEYQNASVETMQTFREWSISNHPTQTDILRKVFLLEFKVQTTSINVTVVMKHYNQDGTKAEIEDIVFTRTGDDSVTYEYNGETLTEREYWDKLTIDQGLTPYQLLDQRIPQMDSEGIFNLNY